MIAEASNVALPERFYVWLREVVFTNPHVSKVILFGSRARGDHRERSDIDLAISVDERREWHKIDGLCEEQAPTLLRIDLVNLASAPAVLLSQIAAEGIVLYER